MYIHFSNVNFSSSSGPNSFACRLAQQMTLDGHNIVNVHDPHDVMLIFIEPTSIIKKDVVTVQRLDGIWFKPDEYLSHNRNIKYAYDNCNYVIWQSQFDKSMTQKYWGNRSGEVVNNGISLSKINVTDDILIKLRESYSKIFVCSASWHRQKRLKENIELFEKIKEKYEDSCLIVLGDHPDYIVNLKDVYYLGNIPHNKCLEIYSIADWFIHLAWLDHCPNVVVEALSQNCPIICTNSGGTHEIVKNNGIVLSESRNYNFELTDYDNPYELLLPDVDNLDLTRIKVTNDHLDIKKISQKYIEIFTKNLRKKF